MHLTPSPVNIKLNQCGADLIRALDFNHNDLLVKLDIRYHTAYFRTFDWKINRK